MSVGDAFLLLIRWLHLLSAAAWVGGSLFYFLVVRPALRRAPDTPRSFITGAATEYSALVNLCIVVLVATGVILAFDRLTSEHAAVPYVITLGVKSALSVWMFLLVRELRRGSHLPGEYRRRSEHDVATLRRLGRTLLGYNAIMIIGILVLLLSDLLKVLFELELS